MTLRGAADLTHLPENERIDHMGRVAAAGEVVGFFVENDAKADRYLARLLERHAIRLIWRGPGPEGSILVKIGPRPH